MNKICTICGRDDQPWFSKKRCKSCAQKSYNQPKRAPIKRTYVKKERDRELDNYFIFHIAKCNKSEESGEYISATKANICHLLPKRKYKSVKSDFRNFVYLTLEQHSRFDYLLDTLQFDKLESEFPNAWPIVCRRVRKILPSVTEQGKLKQKFEEYLNS